MKSLAATLALTLIFTMPTVSVLAAEQNSVSEKDMDIRASDPVRVHRVRADDVSPDRLRYEFIGGRMDNECGTELGPWADSSDKNINDVLKMAYTLNLQVIVSMLPGCKIHTVITVK